MIIKLNIPIFLYFSCRLKVLKGFPDLFWVAVGLNQVLSIDNGGVEDAFDRSCVFDQAV